MFDLISIGDSTLDTFIKIKEASVMCNLDKESCVLCLSYADKIPIIRLDQKIAGNALNVAVGVARLGLKAAIYSIVGSDEIGKKIIQGAKREKVSLKYLQVDHGKPSNYSVVLNYKGERTILVYHHKRKYKLPKLEPTRWIYYTSVAPGYEKLEKEIIKFCKKECPTTHLAFNPGTHQLKKGLNRMRDVLRITTALFLNKEEAWSLVGRTDDLKELLTKLKNLGPKFVVVTDGGRGSYAFNGSDAWYMPVFPAKIVEKTGAGDAFATGVIAALALGKSLAEALRWGTANSTSVIQKIGPQTGLLKLTEMKRMLKQYAQIKPKMI
jgi:ribokinase